ncbi:MAG: hypothetical protein ABSG32_33625, partial [Terriglobia bacterium]
FFLTGMKGYNSLPPSAAPLRHIQSRAEGFNLDRVRTVPDPSLSMLFPVRTQVGQGRDRGVN